MTLLITDVQCGITTDRLHECDRFLSAVRRLISDARENGVEVVYIRHDDGVGTVLEKDTPGYEIYPDFAPLEGERVFDKNVSSPFRSSGLLEYLRQKGEEQIMVTGLFTEYCIDATVKCGFEHGFEVIVPTDANSTADNRHMTAALTHEYYNDFIWNRRYARCVTIDEAVSMLTKRD
ncbi:MAG: isochorismatase family protein [Ruminococcaceae bacterium]|nr:isochorismatase family protein [Oscillospiraceae bacterium]